MSYHRGWWKIKIEAEYLDGTELDETDYEHIFDMAKEGYTSGELIKEE